MHRHYLITAYSESLKIHYLSKKSLADPERGNPAMLPFQSYAIANHRVNGSSSHVLTATFLSYGKAKNSTPTESKPLI